MPLPSFLSSVANKAQHAIHASPLAAHLPSSMSSGPRPSSPDPAPQPSANDAAAQGAKSHTLENISYQFRSFHQQYGTSTPAQRIITASKGVVLDIESVARDTKAQSKELYTWGQNEPEDLKDVTDRLAYLNFVHGSLASTLSTKLNTARNPFKELRNAETALQPRRAARVQLANQIAKVENDPRKAGELRELLRQAELEDVQAEKEIELLKRKAVRESEQLKWEAIREYAEKLVLLSQASAPIVAALPAIPSDETRPYTGAAATAAARASLQRALDNYKTGHINLSLGTPAGGALSRSDTIGFGESHAAELSKISSYNPSSQRVSSPPLHSMPVAQVPQAQSPPINPSTLNNSPVQLPNVPIEAPVPTTAEVTAPIAMPTVAETGIPVGGAHGPASGSLYELKHASTQSGVLQFTPPSQFPVPTHESAEEEKRRLAAVHAAQASPPPPAPVPVIPSYQVPQPAQAASTSANEPKVETAEEEKKRLEREERERILRGQDNDRKRTEEDLPPYQEPSLQ